MEQPKRKHYPHELEWLKANCEYLKAQGFGKKLGIQVAAYQIYLRGCNRKGKPLIILLRGISACGDAVERSRKWKGQYHHWLQFLKVKKYV
nr:hypothetical protein K70PH128C1_LOCUS51 [Klebsiella phage vB_Ko_K70PH128C1]